MSFDSSYSSKWQTLSADSYIILQFTETETDIMSYLQLSLDHVTLLDQLKISNNEWPIII